MNVDTSSMREKWTKATKDPRIFKNERSSIHTHMQYENELVTNDDDARPPKSIILVCSSTAHRAIRAIETPRIVEKWETTNKKKNTKSCLRIFLEYESKRNSKKKKDFYYISDRNE